MMQAQPVRSPEYMYGAVDNVPPVRDSDTSCSLSLLAQQILLKYLILVGLGVEGLAQAQAPAEWILALKAR